eukprot:5273126-Alexandrium_andersonii.AAC.1
MGVGCRWRLELGHEAEGPQTRWRPKGSGRKLGRLCGCWTWKGRDHRGRAPYCVSPSQGPTHARRTYG